jgi:hypothetical protein
MADDRQAGVGPLLRQLARSVRSRVAELATEHRGQPGALPDVLDELLADVARAPASFVHECQQRAEETQAARTTPAATRRYEAEDDDGNDDEPELVREARRWARRRLRT